MTQAEITKYAKFEKIRYAQLWEDADVLLPALGEVDGKTLVSICARRRQCAGHADLKPEKSHRPGLVGSANQLHETADCGVSNIVTSQSLSNFRVPEILTAADSC